MKTAFITDSGCGLSMKEVEELGGFSVPLQIMDTSWSKREYEEIAIEEVYVLMASGRVLKTAQPLLGEIDLCFKQLKEKGYERVFFVGITEGLSGTRQSMEFMANEYSLVFDGFDCGVTANLQADLLRRSIYWYDQQMSLDVIKQRLQIICDHANTWIVPDALDYLARSGRMTPSAAKLGGLLKIKPIFHISQATQGKIDVLTKVRTQRKALDIVLENMTREIDTSGEGIVIHVTHVNQLEVAKAFYHNVIAHFPKANVNLHLLASVVGVHIGPGGIAVQYYLDK